MVEASSSATNLYNPGYTVYNVSLKVCDNG